MSWLQLVLQLLPSVIGIIGEIEKAFAATPSTGEAVTQHVANIKTIIHSASNPAA